MTFEPAEPEGTKEAAENAVRMILTHLGEDPKREGLVDTPARVVRAWQEMTRGYHEQPEHILARRFTVKYDEIVVLRNIAFYSTCEHHLLPFSGTADVGYIPDKDVVGLSKLARLVECFARRLQIQERMTQEIAHAMESCLKPQGVGVIVRAGHLCMRCRGIQKENAEMVTSCMLGAMREQGDTRSEFLRLCQK